jgi:hypothetical protein
MHHALPLFLLSESSSTILTKLDAKDNGGFLPPTVSRPYKGKDVPYVRGYGLDMRKIICPEESVVTTREGYCPKTLSVGVSPFTRVKALVKIGTVLYWYWYFTMWAYCYRLLQS